VTVTDDLAFLTITDLARAIHSREVSPTEVTRAMIERIERVDPRINSYITVTSDLALQQAKQAEQDLASGKDLGPLHGVPIALKDLYATKGIRTTGHSQVLIDWVPDEDATVTALLREAGAVLLGKLAMHEFAFGVPAFDTPFPPARNPWGTGHITGGSSSGSGAALAAGLCYGALGSDTGGSIRSPAALCGVAGIKPTYGRTSRAGVLPLSWSLDHVGPMGRSVADCAVMLQAISGYDPKDPASADVAAPDFTSTLNDGIAGLRIGVPRDWFNEGDGTHAEVLAAFEAAIEALAGQGAQIVEVDSSPFINARAANTIIMISEAYAYHEDTLKTRPQDLSSGVRNRAREGAFLTAADYVDAQRARVVLANQVRTIMRDVDVIASAAAPQPAETFEEQNPDARYRMPSYTPAFNLTGLPAMSVPCGFSSDGFPIGLQIAGRAFDEATVLRVGHSYEGATDWHRRHPDL
jgi:aspartyl-tRNA(Asn)/glutamyl-tRNA(Gln) amidotransferase subunit A